MKHFGLGLFFITVAVALTTTPAWAALDYSSDIGTEFQTDVDANFGLASNNPFGPNQEWEFKFGDGLVGAAVAGGIPWSGQAGWCQSADGFTCTDSGEYGYFSDELWSTPAGGIEMEGVIGHGPHHYTWTAPNNLDEGGITVSGQLQQLFEPDRVMSLRAEWNGNSKLLGTAVPPIANAVGQTRADYSELLEGITPGTVVNFYAEPSETSGNGVPTFVQVGINIEEAVGDPNWTDPNSGGGNPGGGGYTEPPAYDGYRSDLGWWFQKDMEDNFGLPSTTTLGADGEWELRFPENTVGTATMAIPWSGQSGWCQGDGSSCASWDEEAGGFGDPIGEYGYFADEAWGAGGDSEEYPNIPLGTDAITGHGPAQFTWTAPAGFSGDMNVDGYMQQLFENERLMQVRAVINGDEENGQVLGTAVAPLDNSSFFSKAVAYSGTLTGLSAGDTVDFMVEPADQDLTGGNGVNTFVQTSIVLTQPTGGLGGLTGDYNNDGTVDAADYTVYKDAEGTSVTLANDAIGGTVGASHYTQWANAFGQTSGSASAAIPEPTSLLLVLTGLAAMVAVGRRK